MKRGIEAFALLSVVAVVVALHLHLRVPSDEVDALSAALDRRIAEHASRARPRPPLYGETVPGVATDLYREAFVRLAPQVPHGALGLLGQSRDQVVSDEVFDLVTRGARAQRLGAAGAAFDPRSLRRVLKELSLQIASEEVWLQNERLTARGAKAPADGPSFLFHVERILACLRLANDLAVAGFAGREELADLMQAAIFQGLPSWDVDRLDPAEAAALTRGLETWLATAPGPEELEGELDLFVQTRLRARVAGHAGPFVLDRRVREAFELWKTWCDRPVREWTSRELASREAYDLRQLLGGVSPAGWMERRRAFRRWIETYALALRAFLRWEERGAAPESVEEVRPPAVRADPDGGHWSLEAAAGADRVTIRWASPTADGSGNEFVLRRDPWVTWRPGRDTARRR